MKISGSALQTSINTLSTLASTNIANMLNTITDLQNNGGGGGNVDTSLLVQKVAML